MNCVDYPSLLERAIFALVALCSAAASAADDVDKYGGLMDVKGTPGEFFSIQKLGDRWWILTPDGHGTFIRTVSKVDSNNRNVDVTGYGNFQSYDAVYIQPNGGQPTANLKEAAADTLTKDVIDPKSGATLKDVGDAMFIGTDRFKPGFTYFWLDQVGAGGKVQWYYSTGKDWKLINDTGNPFTCAVKNADNSYNLDIGDYLAPDANGFCQWDNKGANRITFFDLAKAGLPADYVPMALPNDPAPGTTSRPSSRGLSPPPRYSTRPMNGPYLTRPFSASTAPATGTQHGPRRSRNVSRAGATTPWECTRGVMSSPRRHSWATSAPRRADLGTRQRGNEGQGLLRQEHLYGRVFPARQRAVDLARRTAGCIRRPV